MGIWLYAVAIFKQLRFKNVSFPELCVEYRIYLINVIQLYAKGKPIQFWFQVWLIYIESIAFAFIQ